MVTSLHLPSTLLSGLLGKIVRAFQLQVYLFIPVMSGTLDFFKCEAERSNSLLNRRQTAAQTNVGE